MDTVNNIMDFLHKVATHGTISGFGGLTHYLYTISRGEEFKFWVMIVTVFISISLGYFCGTVIPEDSAYRDPLLWLSGLCSYPFLEFLERKGLSILKKFTSFK